MGYTIWHVDVSELQHILDTYGLLTLNLIVAIASYVYVYVAYVCICVYVCMIHQESKRLGFFNFSSIHIAACFPFVLTQAETCLGRGNLN